MSRIQPWGISVVEAMTNYAAIGALPARFVVHKFGLNLTAAAGDSIWEPGGAYPYLTYNGTPVAMRVKAGNAADTSTGTGARSVTIQGLDGNFGFASETVATAGASASAATTTTFSRVLRAFVAGTGTGHTNAVAVDIENAAGGTTYARIIAGEGQSQLGFVTVPAGYRGYLTHILLSTDVASASATVRVDGWQRGNANVTTVPFPGRRVFFTELSMSRSLGGVERNFEEPMSLEQYTDMWFTVTPSTGTPEVSVAFTMLFEKI